MARRTETMISSNTRASRSRYSSPATQQRNGNGSAGEAARGSSGNGSRALMKRWLEPPVATKASFEDAGLMRFGVLENMAPLGTLPKAKKNEGGTGTGVRKIILRPSGSGAAAAAAAAAAAMAADVAAAEPTSSSAAAPEAPIAPTTTTADTSSASPPSSPPAQPSNTTRAPASQPVSPTQPVSRQPPRKSLPASSARAATPTALTATPSRGQAMEDDEDYDPKRPSSRRRRSSKPSLPKKGRPPASVRRSSLVASKLPSPDALHAAIMSTPPQPPTPRGWDTAERVIETAIDEALRHYRYPTAYALRMLWDEHSGDAVFVTMMRDVFTQTADSETSRKFSKMLEEAKRHGKRNETGFQYFEPPRSDSLPRKQKALAAPYEQLIQRPATMPDEQGRGETRPTKKIKIIHSGASKSKTQTQAPREDASASASAAAVTGATTGMDTSADADAGVGAAAGMKTPSSRKRGRRHSGSSESSLSSVMSLSSPEMTHRRTHSTTSGHPDHLASPSARRGANSSSIARVKITNKKAAGSSSSSAGCKSRPQPLSLHAGNAPKTTGLQAPNALRSNGSAPKSWPITSARRQSLASDMDKDEQHHDRDQDQIQDQVPDQDQQMQDVQEEQQPSDGLHAPSSPMHGTMQDTTTLSHSHHHHAHAHQNNNTTTTNTVTPASSFLSVNNTHLHPHSNSPSPPQSPTTAVVEERQRHRQQDKIQPAASKKDQHAQDAPRPQRQTRAAASKASSPSTAAAGKDAVADAVVSMPGLITTSLDQLPVPSKKKSPPVTAAATPGQEGPDAQEVATRRNEAQKITNGFTAIESSIRDAPLFESRSRDRDVTPMRSTPGPAFTSTRRATRQSATASTTAPPVSTRSTRSAKKRSSGNDEPDGTASPSVFSFQGGDGSSATASRAVTPTNLPPAKKQKTGLRVKLSPIKKKGGTAAGVPRSMGEAQSSATNGAAKDQTENDEYCSACGNAGDVVCCDGCPRSFHFECVGMDQADDLPDEWYCNECIVRRFPSRVPIHRGIFAGLLNNLEKSIPRAFSLPKKLQNRFEGVKAGADGDYEDLNATKAASKKKNNGYEEAPDFFKQRDEGEAVLCHDCQKPASSDRAIIPCSACPLYWHTDCLDPPLAIPPVLKTWRCPAHTDEVLLIAPPLAPAHRFRRIKGADTITPAISRGLKNNGHIEIDWTDEIEPKADEDKSGWRDFASFGRTYKIPARGVVLDFIEQMRKQGAGYGTPRQKPSRTEPYLTPPVEDREKSLPPVATKPPAERTVEELQASLILTSLKQAPAEGVEQLTSALLTSADPSILSLIAKGNAESIARDRLVETDRQSLRALLAQMEAMSASIRTILGANEQPVITTKTESKDVEAMDADPLVTEPTPPSTIDHAEGAMDYD